MERNPREPRTERRRAMRTFARRLYMIRVMEKKIKNQIVASPEDRKTAHLRDPARRGLVRCVRQENFRGIQGEAAAGSDGRLGRARGGRLGRRNGQGGADERAAAKGGEPGGEAGGGAGHQAQSQAQSTMGNSEVSDFDFEQGGRIRRRRRGLSLTRCRRIAG